MATVATETSPYVNLLDPEWYVDPYDAYRWLRDHSPVHWDPVQRIWGVSRHADVLHVEKHTDLYSSLDGSRPHSDQRDDMSMINQDDPAHQKQRMLVARRFTPRAVRDHEAHIRALVTECIDNVIDDGGCEVVEALASRIPAMVIGELLGYPKELWPAVRRWSEETMLQAGQTPADGHWLEQDERASMSEAIIEFSTETMKVIAERRADPKDDLISVWCHSRTADGTRTWNDAEVLQECILLLDGGAETTRTVIGSIVRELALRPDQRALLVEQPDLLHGTAVEEFIRWVTPISNMRRTVTREHEWQGQELHAGEEVLLLYGAANRDDRVFDDPETFDVTRPSNHHVAFGFGTHFCLGASLARLELRVTFEELLRRIPDFRLADGAEPRIIPATFTRGYDRVDITW
jgi:cytochrome P450 family 142 subfamily A polypeptide 1